MRYTSTEAYRGLLSPRSADVAECKARYEQAARSLEDRRSLNAAATKKKDVKPTALLEKGLAKLERELNEALQAERDVIDLNVKPRYLVLILIQADCTGWNSTYESALWYKTRSANEGAGEAALKIRYGIPEDATYKPGDLILKGSDGELLIYEEVKAIDLVGKPENHNEPMVLQSIQTGKQGRHAYGRWSYSLNDEVKKALPDDLNDAIAIGELTQSRWPRLPIALRDNLIQTLVASRSLGQYNATVATTRYGYIRIPREDCDEAWILNGVTKASPKYDLSVEYLKKRIRASLDRGTEDVPEFLPVESAGEHLHEVVAVA